MIEKEIIKISETNTGVQTVLASDLYNLLTPKTQFRDWIKRMLKYGFLENVDYWTLSSIEANVFRSKMSEKENTPKKGRKLIDYIVTVECAKAIAMVQRSEIGRKIRNYFIEAEKEFRKLATPEQIKSLYTKIEKLESNKVDFTNDWTIDRFLRTNGLTESSSNVFKQQLGKKCTKYLKQKTGDAPKKVQHPSYLNGQNVYPYELINQVYSEIIKK